MDFDKNEREEEWKEYNRKKRSRLKNTDFTIIASNCCGTMMYHDLGLPFLSPTINLNLNPWSSFAGLNCKKQYLRRIPAFWKPNFYHPMGEEIWGFRIAEILVKCEIKGIFIGLNFTDSGTIWQLLSLSCFSYS